MRYVCESHKVQLIIESDRRRIETPPGSLRGIPQCILMTAKEPREGTYGNCTVRKED